MTAREYFLAIDTITKQIEGHHRALAKCMVEQRRLEEEMVRTLNEEQVLVPQPEGGAA